MQHLKQLCLSQTQLTDSNLDILLKSLKVHCITSATPTDVAVSKTPQEL